jgi:hypothetical protein
MFVGLAVAGMATLMPQIAQAQVEVLSPEQIASFRQELPASAKSAAPKLLQKYLQQLARDKNASATEVANAVRVAEDVKSGVLPAAAYSAHYVVPAMSPAMRLPTAYPQDGTVAAPIEIILAQDEYEDGSFVVFPFANVDRVQFSVSDLKSDDGSTLPPSNLDLKVVKVWYQNGNAWLSYFADPGPKLVPELLLHDENLIRVDTKEEANYARIETGKGAKEVWISAPQKLNVGFDPYQAGFVDAEKLQPVELVAGQFKQFILTAHATPQTKPGLYKGNIAVTAEGQNSIDIPVAVRVLPFRLPLPKTNYDINKDFLVTLMSAWPTISTDSKAFLPILKNLRRHNILHLGPGVSYKTSPAQAAEQARLMKEAGFLTKPIFGDWLPGSGDNNRPPRSFDQQMEMKRLAKRYHDFYQKNFGHSDAFVKQGDEQRTAWLISNRPNWRITQQQGLKVELAGHIGTYLPTAGYVLDSRPTAGYPGETDKANLWRAVSDGYTSFYAGQHTGSENPAFIRRQHGLEGYLANFDMVNNYHFAYGPWNDFSWDLYKPMVLAYPISDGLVDTLNWEGFREGIDDIRYATKLRQLAAEAIDSGKLDRVYAGRKAQQWLALMDADSVDLNAVRMEMIKKITSLLQMA